MNSFIIFAVLAAFGYADANGCGCGYSPSLEIVQQPSYPLSPAYYPNLPSLAPVETVVTNYPAYPNYLPQYLPAPSVEIINSPYLPAQPTYLPAQPSYLPQYLPSPSVEIISSSPYYPASNVEIINSPYLPAQPTYLPSPPVVLPAPAPCAPTYLPSPTQYLPSPGYGTGQISYVY